MPSITEFTDLYRIGGVKAVLIELVGYGYRNTIRKLLPVSDFIPRFGGVQIPPRVASEYSNRDEFKILDTIWPWTTPGNRWLYEHDLSAAIKETVEPDDTVIIIGGGVGVTTVVAAREVGPTGSVMVYEGGGREVDWVKQTIAKNDVENTVTVKHALVGPDVNTYSSTDGAEHVAPNELPPYDVLVSDCEGAEYELIKGINKDGRELLIETHGFQGSPTNKVASLLNKERYDVSMVGLESTDRDVRILRAINKQA